MSEPMTSEANSTSDTTRGAAGVASAAASAAANLTKVNVDSQNKAFNLIVSFVGVAQRRGAFALDEAAKIFECIEMFKKDN